MRILSLLLTIVFLYSCEEYIGIPQSPPRQASLLKVSWEGTSVSISRKYVMSHDLIVTLGPCGGNSLIQLERLTYVPNLSDTICDTNRNGPTYYSSTDWIGPYWMVATQNGNGNSGFTGGWHAYNGDFTGSPTARTQQIKVYADDKLLDSRARNIQSQYVKVVVDNYIQAGNTKETDGSGREVLKESVCYLFHQDTIHVSVTSKALEDINIENYYGLQACFGGMVRMFCADSVYTCYTNGYHGTMARVHAAECTMDDGHQVLCLLDQFGLGTQDQFNICTIDTNRQFCFTSPYGKTYFRLVGEVGMPLHKGEVCYWQGAYIFREKNVDIK